MAAPEGLVTFLMSDVEGSTAALKELGSAYRGEVARVRSIIRAAAADAGGFEVDAVGDSMLLAFSTADAAAACARAAQNGLAGGRLRVRMGIHTGEAVPHDGVYVALAVHQAARVMAAAHGGQALASDEAAEHLGRAGLRNLGRYRVRDFGSVVSLWQVGEGRFPPPRVPPERLGNLPTHRLAFVGRDAELRLLGGRMGEPGLLTLAGPGGVGKTRLALQACSEAAWRFEDGVWLVELSAIRDPSLVAGQAAAAIGLTAAAGSDVVAQVAEWAARHHALIVLDNCEHVLGAAAALAAAILRARPDGVLVATSRERLRVAGERVIPVEPLAVAPPAAADPLAFDAARLFIERGQAAGATFQLDAEEQRALTELCTRLDGLPLALEIAASRTPAMGLLGVAARVRRRLGDLSSGERDPESRQRSLRALVDWSHELLSPDERMVLRRLSVFAGRFTPAAAEAVCSGGDLGGAVEDALANLVDRSLVQLRQRDGRHRLLDVIREYAADRLAESGETEAVATRLVAWARSRVDELCRGGTSFDERSRQAVEDLDNIRAAFAVAETSSPADAASIAAGVAPLIVSAGAPLEARRMLERAVAAGGHGDGDLAVLLERLAAVCTALGPASGARDLGRRAQELARATGDRQTELRAAASEAVGCAICGEAEQAVAAIWPFRDAVFADRLGTVARIRNAAGVALIAAGRPEEGEWYLRAALAASEADGSSRAMCATLTNLSWMLAERGESDEAARALARVSELAAVTGDPVADGRAQMMLAWVRLREADLLGSAAAARAAAAAFSRSGDLMTESHMLADVVHLAGFDDALFARLHGASAAALKREGTRLYSPYEAIVEAARARLGPDEFDRLAAIGGLLAPDRALEEALTALEALAVASEAAAD